MLALAAAPELDAMPCAAAMLHVVGLQPVDPQLHTFVIACLRAYFAGQRAP